MVTHLVLLFCASIAAAAIALRGQTLRAYLSVIAAEWAIAWLVWRVATPEDADLALIAFGVLQLATFCVALSTGTDVRWSASRAAAVAAIVYAFVIPTQMRTPIDGDEPYYLLITESMVKDHDLDLANQYRDIVHSATGRPDLRPQPGDPVGRHGEQYSRHEPFLPLLLVPGYAVAGLPGALATIALFGVLLVRSTVRWLEDEGVAESDVRALFPLFAFGPPVLFYAARIWPEVPGAFFFVEALRGVRQQRLQRALPALFALVMLKLRFVLIGIVLAGAIVVRTGKRGRLSLRHAVAAAMLALPLAVVWAISGSVLNVHGWWELLPFPGRYYYIGTFGLLLDGASGMLFQAPLYLLGVFAMTRWRWMPEGARLGAIAALPYLVSLVPRSEWHGGWAPPLRYVVVFMPLLFLAAAALMQRVRAGAYLAIASIWTIGVAIHGLAFPWRLFHIFNGENPLGEWLSEAHRSDFSRLFPSFIRLNAAAVVASVLIVVAFVALRVVRVAPALVAPALALLLAVGFVYGDTPAGVVEFEDAHVIHRGGELYPEEYTVARFLHRCGWQLHPGDSMSFLAKAGRYQLEYACATPVTIELGRRAFFLPATGSDHRRASVEVATAGRVEVKSLDGVVDLDRMSHE